MTLYPGGRQSSGSTYVYSVSDQAMAGSMAQAMEDEMEALFAAIKQQPLPANGKEGRLILFTSIARGVLKYLYDKQQAGEVDLTADLVTGTVKADITLDHT